MHSIVFFGSSTYSLIILKKLLTLPNFDLKAVVTKPDKPFGRDQKIIPNPVAAFALDHHLPLLQPDSFTPDFLLEIRNLKLDIFLCVAYGPPFFTSQMCDLPKYGIINIHPSPLPKYRGATPGPWQIINGETTSAVTFFKIDPLPDHGPIITQIPFDISTSDTADSFYLKAFTLAANQLESVLIDYIQNPQNLLAQDHSHKTYFPKLSKDQAKINWAWDPAKIERFIRALNPWPTAWTYVQNPTGEKFKMKIFSASIRSGHFPSVEPAPQTHSEKNDYEDAKKIFICEPIITQIEGKKPTKWAEINKHYKIITSP